MKLVAYVIAVVMNMEHREIIELSGGAAVLKELFAIYAASNVNITMTGTAGMIRKVARKCVNLYSQIEKTKEILIEIIKSKGKDIETREKEYERLHAREGQPREMF